MSTGCCALSWQRCRDDGGNEQIRGTASHPHFGTGGERQPRFAGEHERQMGWDADPKPVSALDKRRPAGFFRLPAFVSLAPRGSGREE
eukprot:358811-Chlamydomonas_euryale.AAC.28